jgi:CRISPR system Cascade subunit CasD
VAVSLKEKENDISFLSTIADALQNPRWPIYLGRKSCVPSQPVFNKLTNDYPNIERAFQSESLDQTYRSGFYSVPDRIVAWIEYPQGEYERQDAIRINPLRFYGYRNCKRIEIETQPLLRRELT